MTSTPAQILMRAARLGVKLGTRPGDKITFEPAERCPPEFVGTLRAHKAQFLELLRRNDFVLVDSKAVGDLLFFCEDEDTKEDLLAADAEEWRIYTRDELKLLVEQNRIKPFTEVELWKVHEIKRTFHGRIASGNGG
jgi:hypothetical protein